MRDRPIYSDDKAGYAEVLGRIEGVESTTGLLSRALEEKDNKIAQLKAALILLLEKYTEASRDYSYSEESIGTFPEVVFARKVLGE